MDWLVDINRKLENLLRYGIVASVDGAARRCTVKTGDLVTRPMRWLVQRAGEAVTQWHPSVGEHVAVLCPGGDPARGFVMPALYSDEADTLPGSDTANVTRYADGAIVCYDPQSHQLSATLPDGGTVAVMAPGGVSIHGDTTITGKLHITQDVTVDAGLQAKDDVVAGTVSLQQHLTTNVTAGSSVSGPPKP